MSILSEQVKRIRDCVKKWQTFENIPSSEPFKLLSEAADTIEALSAKLQAANMERSDMISRNKLIKEINKEIDGVIVKDTYSKGKNAGLRKAKILAEEQTVTHYGGGWIACEDRLPDGGGMYIVTAVENGLYHTTFAKWQSRYKEWDLRGCRSHWKVIAWQPLPESFRP